MLERDISIKCDFVMCIYFLLCVSISSHIKRTRLDVRNGVAVCKLHHKFCKYHSFHGGSLGAMEWLKKMRPEDYKYLLSTLPPIKKFHQL